MRRTRKQRKDYRFSIARSEPIDPAHRELARALLAEETDKSRRRVLKELRKLSVNRRASGTDTGPFLDVREAEDGRSARIVVRDGRYTESTGFEPIVDSTCPGGFRSPEESLDAVVYLDGYLRRAVMKSRCEVAGEDVLVMRLVDEFLEAFKPDGNPLPSIPGLTPGEVALSEGDPRKWHANQTNFAKHLKTYFAGKALGQVTRELGRLYQAQCKKRKDENGNKAPLADGSIRQHLFLLQRAIGWGLDEGKIKLRVHFDMPDFGGPNPNSLEWEEVVRLILVCRGLVPENGGFRMKTVLRNGVARQVWDKDWLADRATMKAAERYIKTYFLTGTREKSIPPLTWSPSNWHGFVDEACRFLHRAGKKSKQHKQKPRSTSEVLPFVTSMLLTWKKIDRKSGFCNPATWVGTGPQDWVVHDTNGNPVKGLTRLVDAIFERAGVETSDHKLKHSGVTVHHKRGFGISQIANLYGTDEQTLRDTYVQLRWEDRISPEASRDITSFQDLCGKVPRYGRPCSVEAPQP